MVDRTFHAPVPKSSRWLSALGSGQASIGGRGRRAGIAVEPEVDDALRAGHPVVALETTIICHGIPRPENAELALEIDNAVRAAGAVPATTAVIDGELRVGLAREALVALAHRDGVRKCTTRDLADVIAAGGTGATTVAATLAVATLAGIRVMATGGIGGVHRAGEVSLDVSADLDELARRPAIVVASGIKTILDVGRTLERLESLGVPVVGYGTDEMPAFYTRSTGVKVPRVDEPQEVAVRFELQRELGLPGALLVARPPPAELALDRTQMERWIAGALEEARAAGIAGPAETPFLLQRLAQASGGRTVRLNRALAVANAALAARLAVAVCGTG